MRRASAEALREAEAVMQEALEQAQSEEWWAKTEIRMQAATEQARRALGDTEHE